MIEQIETELAVTDKNGLVLSTGNYVKMPVTCNTEMHGLFAYYEIIMQGGFPIVSYLMSDSGHPLPPGYLRTHLSDYYDPKALLWATAEHKPAPIDGKIERINAEQLPHENVSEGEWRTKARNKRLQDIENLRLRQKIQKAKIDSEIWVAYTKKNDGAVTGDFGLGVTEAEAVDDSFAGSDNVEGARLTKLCRAVSDQKEWHYRDIFYADETGVCLVSADALKIDNGD